MSSHGPSASAHSSSGPDSLLFELLDLESFDPPAIHEELTESYVQTFSIPTPLLTSFHHRSTTTTYDHGSPKCTRECVEDPHAPYVPVFRQSPHLTNRHLGSLSGTRLIRASSPRRRYLGRSAPRRQRSLEIFHATRDTFTIRIRKKRMCSVLSRSDRGENFGNPLA